MARTQTGHSFLRADSELNVKLPIQILCDPNELDTDRSKGDFLLQLFFVRFFLKAENHATYYRIF